MAFKTNYRLMQVKRISECSKGSILQYFSTFIKLFVIQIFVLFNFEWPFYTGFTVLVYLIFDALFSFRPHVNLFDTDALLTGRPHIIDTLFSFRPHVTLFDTRCSV